MTTGLYMLHAVMRQFETMVPDPRWVLALRAAAILMLLETRMSRIEVDIDLLEARARQIYNGKEKL